MIKPTRLSFDLLALTLEVLRVEGVMKLFAYLHYGLAAVLVFVGAKMLVAGFYKIPTLTSLLVIVGLLTVAVAASLLLPRPIPAPRKLPLPHPENPQ